VLPAKIRRGPHETGAGSAPPPPEAVQACHAPTPNIRPDLRKSGEFDGRPYSRWNYVPGGSLGKNSWKKKKTTLAAAGGPELAGVTAGPGAMQHAHERGSIHRRLKPAETFMARGRRGRGQKIMEFGMPKAGRSYVGDTASYAILGTPSTWSGTTSRAGGTGVGPGGRRIPPSGDLVRALNAGRRSAILLFQPKPVPSTRSNW